MPRQRIFAIAGGLLIFLIAVLSLDTVLLGRQVAAAMSVPDAVQNFVNTFLGIFIEAAPFLLIGSLASGLVAVFISTDELQKLIPKNPVLATVVGSLLGMLFPVCECGVVPLARRLYSKGMPPAAVIALLLGAPVLNPVVIASTYAAFGNSAVFWWRLVFTFVIAFGAGLVFLSMPDRDIIQARFLTGGANVREALKSGFISDIPMVKESFASQLQRALNISVDDFFDTGKYMVVGTLAASAFQTFVPQQLVLGIGTNAVTSVVAMIALAYLLSVCSTVDSFLALSFVNTFSTGSIVAFLVFGPMMDVKSTLMFLSLFRRKIVIYLVVLLALSAFVAGMIIT